MTTPFRRRLPLAAVPWLGLGLAALGGLLFLALARAVGRNGRLVRWDEAACQAVHTRALRHSPVGLALVKFCAALGRELALLLTLALGVWWLCRRQWQALTMLLAGVIGGNTWFMVLSQRYQRRRPSFPDPLHTVPGPGFPSGHSITAITLYSLLLLRAWPHLRTALARWLGVAGTGVVVAVVGLSRLYLGDHFPLDVMGGYSFGICWAALTYTLIARLPHRSLWPNPTPCTPVSGPTA